MSLKTQDMVLTRRGLRFMGQHWPCTYGKGGVRADKREGDGATPVGVHRITGLLYRPDRMAPPTDWAVPIRPGDLWSDDLRDKNYNLMVRAPYPHSHERLRRADPLYDLVLLTDWNWPFAQRGRGSAIFIHRWRRPGYPTEGCVAFRPDHLLTIARNVTLATRLVVPDALATR
ncbi:L,D-peptidoglycan transpeptidase YkuD (ErfK/YbiS/YcfS/YnhG family) [Sagittula marina]|uniref:L,D-peptidoglycan transpeptidase YkuD (ErfK/YbiS/YcfS/YnhG family) n=1 Tax=Sagittula marina TaxID=943940 RepID=A0A7W6GT21_9RHOB|nr:L,D-transpeptidase family protein [Sagittula marina]MBB3984724.1 L,D-peptidoglycan transpeptidase YkuD (ErfK/YbiS/YcfS/YnhG family) [Sagittula marina]